VSLFVVLLAVAIVDSMAANASDAKTTPEWRLIFTTSSDEFYLRDGTVQLVAGLARAWVLTNHLDMQYDEETGEAYRSTLALREFDCHERRHRTLQMTLYSEPHGYGEVVYSFTRASEWRFATPDTAGDATTAQVCAEFKRKTAPPRPRSQQSSPPAKAPNVVPALPTDVKET